MTAPQAQPATASPAPHIRERMLVGGPTGTSKTYSFLKIVEHLHASTHAVIEVDDGFERILLTEFPNLQATIYDFDEGSSKWVPRQTVARGGSLRIFHCRSFTEVMSAQRELEQMISSGTLSSQSWVCVDGIDLLYNSMRYELIDKALSRRHYQKLKKEMTAGEEWEEALEVRARGAPLLEGGDWDMIHSFYERFLTYLTFKIPANVYVTCSTTLISDKSPYEDENTKKFYESLGVPLKFEGQKRTPRVFDTLLAMVKNPNGYYVSIWKDRGGAGRPWSQTRNPGPTMLYENKEFYQDIGVVMFGWS